MINPMLQIFLIFFIFSSSCNTFQKPDDKFFDEIKKDITVYNIRGKTLTEASENAKYKILEIGLSRIENAYAVCRHSRWDLESFPADIFILDYSERRQEKNANGIYIIDATARLNLERIQNEFFVISENNFYLIVNIEEEIDLPDTNDHSITRNSLFDNLPDFKYLDSEQFQKYLTKEGIVKIRESSKIEDKKIELASKFGAQILLLGKTKVKKKKTDESEQWEISINWKFLDVNKNKIITTIKAEFLFPMNQPINQIVGSIIKAYKIPVQRKFNEYRYRPNIITFKLYGISYDLLLERGDLGIIRSIKGVNAIHPIAYPKDKNSVTLKINGDLNGFTIYERLRKKKSELGINFKQKVVKHDLIEIQIIK